MAVARKLLLAALHTLSTGEYFRRPRRGGYLDQVARKRSTTKLVQRLSNLGYDVMLVPKAAQPIAQGLIPQQQHPRRGNPNPRPLQSAQLRARLEGRRLRRAEVA